MVTFRAGRLLLLCLPLVVIAAAALIVGTSGRAGSLSDVLNEYVATGRVDHADDQLLWNVAEPFTAGTPYQANLAINTRFDPDRLNFYVLRDDPRQYFRGLTCNCAAVEGHTVVCDRALLQHFRELLHDDDPERGRKAFEDAFVQHPSDEQVVQFGDEEYRLRDAESLLAAVGQEGLNRIYDLVSRRFSFALLQWIVGHEIGHIALGHVHGAAGSASTGEARRTHQEVGADEFMIGRLAGNDTDAAYFWLAIVSVVRTLFADESMRAGAIGAPAALPKDPASWPDIALVQDGAASHPPLLLRAIDLFVRVIALGGVTDSTGDSALARRHVRVKTGATVPGTLCDTKIQPLLSIALVALDQSAEQEEQVDLTQAWDYVHLADLPAAEAAFSRAIATVSGLEDADPGALSDSYLGRGNTRFIQGRQDAAIADWQQALEAYPDNVYAMTNLGFGFYERRQYVDASSWFTKAIHEGTDADADAYAGLAVTLAALGRMDEAIDDYQRALTMHAGYGSESWLIFERHWTPGAACVAMRLRALVQHGGGRNEPMTCW